MLGVVGKGIEYVGSAAGAPAGQEVDFGEAILLPGLVNAHTHLELTAMRGSLEELEFAEWIDKLRASRNEILSDAMLLDSARHGIAEGLLAGITTYADTCASGAVLPAMLEMGVRGIMFQEVFGPAPERRIGAMQELRARLDAARPSADSSLVRVGVSPHAPYTVSDELYEDVARYAREAGLPLAVHVAESAEECDLVSRGAGTLAARLSARGIATPVRGRSPIALLDSLGALGADTLLIHGVHVDAADVALMTARGCAVAHCPVSTAKLGHGVAPLTEMLSAGLAVGLGSDSVASNNRMHMLEEARTAVLQQRARLRSHDAVPAVQALELATIGGAKALHLDARVGTLEPGKDADFAVFDVGAAALPVGDPVAAAIFSLGGTAAKFVAVAGKPLVRDGRLLAANDDVAGRVAAAGRALRAWHDAATIN